MRTIMQNAKELLRFISMRFASPLQKLGLLPTPSPKPTTTPFTTLKPTTGTGFKRLTWAEMQARREKL